MVAYRACRAVLSVSRNLLMNRFNHLLRNQYGTKIFHLTLVLYLILSKYFFSLSPKVQRDASAASLQWTYGLRMVSWAWHMGWRPRRLRNRPNGPINSSRFQHVWILQFKVNLTHTQKNLRCEGEAHPCVHVPFFLINACAYCPVLFLLCLIDL
jgi:hypothetical protein